MSAGPSSARRDPAPQPGRKVSGARRGLVLILGLALGLAACGRQGTLRLPSPEEEEAEE